MKGRTDNQGGGEAAASLEQVEAVSQSHELQNTMHGRVEARWVVMKRRYVYRVKIT